MPHRAPLRLLASAAVCLLFAPPAAVPAGPSQPPGNPEAVAPGSADLRAIRSGVDRFRAELHRLAAARGPADADFDRLAALALVEPGRFAAEPAFRTQVLSALAGLAEPKRASPLREDLLAALARRPEIDFDATEALAVGWGAWSRASAERRVEREAFRFDDDASREIEASIYSLPSAFFSAGEARRFLAAVHAAAPRRELLVLADPGMRRALAGLPSLPGVRTLPTFGRPYSPWPRDPMSLVRRPGGGFALLLRPNLQRGREEDASLGRALAAALPGDLDRRWGHPRWATAAVPFHNGQVLLTGDAAWITIHTLEPRILALLGLERVPVESFRSAEGLDRYLTAARAAAAELSALYGRPARFVHPLPEAGDPAARLTAMRDLGGGAGIDLDSIVTLLPAASETSGGRQRALVADLSLGRGLLATATAADFASLRLGYGLAADLDPARGLESTLGSERALALGRFLDATAGELSAQGFEVRRLPLLLVPFTFLADAAGLPPDGSFLIGWNNAVLETRNGELRAEAFASLIPAGDRAASATYGALGTHLELLPALPKSVVLGGGYRCASNHVRR